MNVSRKAMFALAFVVLELSFWSIFLQIAGSKMGVIPELFYGFLVALVVSIAISLVADRGASVVSIAKNHRLLLMIIAIGLVNNALTQLFLAAGTLGTNPSISAIVYRGYVIIVALLLPFMLKQKVKSMQLLASVIGFVGVYVVISGGTLVNISMATAPAMALLIFAGLCTTSVQLFFNKYNFNAAGGVVIFNLASLVFISLLAAATQTSLGIAFTPSSAVAVLFLGAFGYALGPFMVYYVIRAFGPLLFGNAVVTVPFFTILFAALLTATPIEPYYLVAALLIGAGVIIQRSYASRQERITKNKALDRFTIFDVTGVFISNKSPTIMKGIAGENRAFAIRLSGGGLEEKTHADVFNKYGCISFTNKRPHASATSDEIRSINEAMKLNDEETALIGIGHPDGLESAFAEFISTSGSRGEDERLWRQ
ncbi:MAG: EamA family transporter [Candidatus Micrarchaeota archaeon]|nr:EamA family transporter [Candidatus Micrarchaeota archaeon]